MIPKPVGAGTGATGPAGFVLAPPKPECQNLFRVLRKARRATVEKTGSQNAQRVRPKYSTKPKQIIAIQSTGYQGFSLPRSSESAIDV